MKRILPLVLGLAALTATRMAAQPYAPASPWEMANRFGNGVQAGSRNPLLSGGRKMKNAKGSDISVECTKDEVLMLNGCLLEIHELFCYENRNKTANRFDFEKDIGLPMSETDALRNRIGSAYEEGKDRMTTWRFRFRREELVAILNSIRKLISPRSSLLWELGIRTGFDPDEFSALADRIQTILNESANPQTDSGGQ